MLVIKRPYMGFIIGTLLASVWPDLALLLSPLCLLLSFFLGRTATYFLFFLLVGVVWVNVHWAMAQSSALPLSAGKSQSLITGEVGFVSKQGHKSAFDFMPVGQGAKLKVSCYRCPYTIMAGEHWQLSLRVKPIHSFQNPGGFDYRSWMLAKGYSAQAYVDIRSSNNQLIHSSPLGYLNRLSQLLSPDHYPILRALILGDKSGLKGDDKRLVFASGISHLFVVSGLHVGIVAGLVGLLVYWFQRPLLLLGWRYGRSVSVALGLSVACLYGFVTGFQVPAIRAVLMLGCGVFMLYQTRFTHVIHYYLFALFIVMLAKPLAFMDMGSWLSFSIVLALILGFSSGKRPSWFRGLIKAQWLAFCMGGLVLLGFNQAVVPFSLIINFVLIPLFTLFVMPAILIALFCAFFGQLVVLTWLEWGLEYLLTLLHRISDVMTWSLPVFIEHRFLLMFALGLLLLPRVLGLRMLAGTAILVVLLLPVKKSEYGGFKLIVFDVGQGSAALVQTQNHSVLVDTGAKFMTGLGLADFVILPYLRQQTVRHLDMLHVTHEDNDHAGGLALIKPLASKVVGQRQCESATWQYDGVIFSRFQAIGFTEGNNGSCLLKVTSSVGQSVLFTGDIEKEAEQALIAQDDLDLTAEILISPHHGSRTSSSDGFLDEVGGQVVVVSSGFLNHYGHPHEQILHKYATRNMMVYTTAHDGAVQVAFPPRQEALVVSTYRPNFGITE